MKPKTFALASAFTLIVMLAACSQSPRTATEQSQPKPAANATSAPQPGSPSPAVPAKIAHARNLWKSETTGKIYRVTIKGNRLVADWVNVPPRAVRRGSYIHTVCRKEGSKWVGSSSIFMACSLGQGAEEHVANTCHLKLRIEFTTVTPNLIVGRGQGLRRFDCRTCKVLAADWASFKWVPMQ